MTTGGPRIVVRDRVIQGGLDTKFEYNTRNVSLHGLLAEDEYRDIVKTLNEHLKKSRPTKLDGALLVTGPLMVPVAVWGIRHSRQRKRRRILLKEAIEEFNDNHELLWMQYNKRQSGSFLSIEKRQPNHGQDHTDHLHTDESESECDDVVSTLRKSNDAAYV
mmetsp:Transcript_3323/g.5046  ORF Transcript_3323/g.5046 Transcript_3323/m.5046 type:complete len:162 (-) Transcript_3323:162-647(-)|eukprot:CAMPEP_0194224144 /NCGR_PEP_ID=MMETSP0156-20130528/36778_1 /TAXON_ID=33649 /ORGANISM="Thalassionema nitzschioides, Strain L26-B" /LENGTH=161 /DNA_ID=CAMNT_0038955573 /DNA_START=61 /DNA_END=546 /DNA_ORIENTATION=+